MELKIGDIFKDFENDYCKITGLTEENVYISYAHTLKELEQGNHLLTDSRILQNLIEGIELGKETLINTRVTNWRKRLQ